MPPEGRNTAASRIGSETSAIAMRIRFTWLGTTAAVQSRGTVMPSICVLRTPLVLST